MKYETLPKISNRRREQEHILTGERALYGKEHVFAIFHIAHGLSDLFEHDTIVLAVLIGAARGKGVNNGKKKRKMSAATVSRNRIRTSALIDYCSNINADRVWWTTLIVMNRIRGVGVIVDNNITMHKNCQEMETTLVSFRKRSNNLFHNVALARAIFVDKRIFQDHQRTGWRAIDYLSNRPYARTSTTESFSTDVGE